MQRTFKTLLVLFLTSLTIGSAAALFLWSLDAVTLARFDHPWLIWLLPLAGCAMGFYYRHHGKDVSSANVLIVSESRKPLPNIPFRLAPGILISTLVTHLFGGSAGREGTAVQMGAGIAAGFSTYLKTESEQTRLILLCGIAGGFAAVFGTPFAAAVFALEFTRLPILSRRIIPCLLTAMLANRVCHAWGIVHTPYPEIRIDLGFWQGVLLACKCLVLAIIIAIVARSFIHLSTQVSEKFRQWFPHEAVRGTAGGLILIGLFLWVGHSDYLGLGILADHPNALTLSKTFSPEIRASGDAWLWKLAFTVITISAGFKGGEVTPLFFIGAALGNSIAWFINAPVSLFAGISMISLFATCSKTPYASLIMGIELLGWPVAIPLAFCLWIAAKLSGKDSIYPR